MKAILFVLLLSFTPLVLASAPAKSCFTVQGMTCGSCKEKIESKLHKAIGVKEAEVSLKNENLKVQFDPEKMDEDKIIALIAEAGYLGIKTECQK